MSHYCLGKPYETLEYNMIKRCVIVKDQACAQPLMWHAAKQSSPSRSSSSTRLRAASPSAASCARSFARPATCKLAPLRSLKGGCDVHVTLQT